MGRPRNAKNPIVSGSGDRILRLARLRADIAPRKHEGERRTLAHRGLCRNGPPVPLDDTLHDGEAHAGPFEFTLVVQPLKHGE